MSVTAIDPADLADADRVPIKARRVRFDWQDTPLHWIDDDPQTTHTINVLHLLLPAGEKWFVQFYRQVLPQVSDERLAADVKGFIGQEATHSRAHAAVLEHLAAQGLDTEPYTRGVDWLFERLLGDRPLGMPVPGFLRGEWVRHRLALIAGIEHFTSALGSWLLENETLPALDPPPDPIMFDMLKWHAAEEVEHRAVAYELSRHMGGGGLRRFVAMLETVPALLWFFGRGVFFLMRHDPSKPGRPKIRSFLRAGRTQRLPSIRQLLRMVRSYLRPGYHPLQEGSTKLAEEYLAQSPAATAARAAAASAPSAPSKDV